MKKSRLLIFCCFCFLISNGQNTRISDKNAIGWYIYTGTIKLDKKWSIHTEYQWRRDNFITGWQQGLLRTGINYKVNDKLSLRTGFAWAETYNYGDIPINGFGKNFSEYRAYEMATISDKLGKVELNHRFMLEQRWVGKYSNASLQKEDQFIYVNRVRYMARLQMPLKGQVIKNGTPYLALYDEMFIGFGKNVNENVFDQNRLGLLGGYRFSQCLRVEAGFISQIAQLSREVNGRNVFQYNNGFTVAALLNFGY